MTLTAATRQGAPGTGAWGLSLSGDWLDDSATRLLLPAPQWPSVAVAVERQPQPLDLQQPLRWSHEQLTAALPSGGLLSLLRDPLQARLELESIPTAECIVQPFLASVASLINIWQGHEAFHAGAFVLNGQAWALLGDKGAGKSTALGCLAQRSVPVLTDDLLVLHGSDALAGPRCVDLRTEAAQRLGDARDLGVVGRRERWRIDLPPVPIATTLAGFVFLEWTDTNALRPLSLTERMDRLLSHRAVQAPLGRGTAMMDLAALPAYVWGRPQSWTTIDAGLDEMLEEIGS